MKISKLTITHQHKTLVDISFNIDVSLALVGQSGSGKSLSIKALLNMLPQGMELAISIKSHFDLIAGKTVGFVPQNPFTALSPLTKIKHQFFISKEQINILDLLMFLQKQLGFKMLFVTHDIAAARVLCDDTCIIKEGRVVESGTMAKVLEDSRQKYTKQLIEASFIDRNFRR